MPARGGHDSRRLHHRSHVPESRARAATGASQDGRSHGSTPTSWGVDAPPGELYGDHHASSRQRGTSRATIAQQSLIPQGSQPIIKAHTAAFLRRDGSSLIPTQDVGILETDTPRRPIAIASRRLRRLTPQGSSPAIAESAPPPMSLIRDSSGRPQSPRGDTVQQGSVLAPAGAAQPRDTPAEMHDRFICDRTLSRLPRTPRENQGASDPTNTPVRVQRPRPRSRSPLCGVAPHVATQPPRGMRPPGERQRQDLLHGAGRGQAFVAHFGTHGLRLRPAPVQKGPPDATQASFSGPTAGSSTAPP